MLAKVMFWENLPFFPIRTRPCPLAFRMAQYIQFSMPKKNRMDLLYIIVHHLLLFINWPTIFFTVGDKSLDWTAQRAQTDDSTFNKYYICCVLRNNTNYNRCNSKSFKFQSLILWWEYNLLRVAAVYTWRKKKKYVIWNAAQDFLQRCHSNHEPPQRLSGGVVIVTLPTTRLSPT